ncbi:MAG: TraR/DksA C4-type zinc finger protein [Candidatus Omnitrophota bacterium]
MKSKKMPKKELAKYRKLLLNEKAKIFAEFLHLKNDALNKSQKEASGDLSGYSYHLADMASDLYETDFMLRLAADERERLYAIDDALKRLEEKDYGMCLTCGKPIPKKRLNAIPQTANCLKCQSDSEGKKTRQ